jgi:hypothetical protein
VSGEAAIRTSRNARTAARTALRTRLEQWERTARALNSDTFRAPLKRTDQALIDSGHAFVVDVEPLKNAFIMHGLPPDDMKAAVEALERAILDYTAAQAMRSAAIREFNKTMDDAMRYLRRLEALVANTLADNPTAMASWTVARSIHRAANRRAPVTPVTPVNVVNPPDSPAVLDPVVVPAAA